MHFNYVQCLRYSSNTVAFFAYFVRIIVHVRQLWMHAFLSQKIYSFHIFLTFRTQRIDWWIRFEQSKIICLALPANSKRRCSTLCQPIEWPSTKNSVKGGRRWGTSTILTWLRLNIHTIVLVIFEGVAPGGENIIEIEANGLKYYLSEDELEAIEELITYTLRFDVPARKVQFFVQKPELTPLQRSILLRFYDTVYEGHFNTCGISIKSDYLLQRLN